jgi:transposase-like protein
MPSPRRLQERCHGSGAVDSEGEILDLLAHEQRDQAAAVKLMRKLLKK